MFLWGNVRLLLDKSPRAVVPNPGHTEGLQHCTIWMCGPCLIQYLSNFIHAHSANDLMS